MFDHLLITRFNLRKDDWETSKKNNAVLTDEWHKNRFALFDNYCFPSVCSQTNQNFQWLVFFDITTPQKYKEHISTLEEKMQNFKPIYVDGMEAFLPSIKSYIESYNQDYLITSRLDNDDCISKFYIDEIQKKFNNQDYLALDFINGYTIQTSPSIKIGKRLDQYNPFITLIEKNENPKTVWHIRHSHWKKEKHILQIKNVEIWTSIIHEENKVNEFLGYGKVNLSGYFENFKISEQLKEMILKDKILQNKWRIQSFFNLCSSKWNLSYKNLKKSIGLYK
jgi:Putative rhamnosyl transferase